MKKYLLAFMAAMFVSCVSTSSKNEQEAKQPPKITYETSLEDALQAGIDFGGETARDVRKMVTKRKQWPLAEKVLYQAIQDGIIKYENTQLLNAVYLYIAGPVTPQEALFKQMVSSGRPLARQLAWQMAGALPGKVMRNAMEHEINRAVYEDEEEELLIPAMATAVKKNRMESAYSLIREGLFSTSHEEFAVTLAAIGHEKASGDFLNYLALCPAEELRQMTISTINIISASVALNHLIKYPPNINHNQIEILFNYAISRNPSLSDAANSVIEVMSQKNQTTMALALARMPVWIQVAFIESARRNMTAPRREFLTELKRVAAQSEVVDELGEIKL